jgi:hypothetical protein
LVVEQQVAEVAEAAQEVAQVVAQVVVEHQ